MQNFLTQVWRREDGAAASEYALILAVVAIGIGIAAGLLGTAVDTALRNACGDLNGTGIPC
jgi:pilus assembly protein Flp/PilA